MWLGLVYIWTKRAAVGIAKCEHALVLDRNLARAEGAIGFGKINIGRAEETEAHIAEALRLSPRDTTAFVWMNLRGPGEEPAGELEQAVTWCRRAIEANPNYPRAYFQLALALAQLGRLDEAHSSVKAGIAINPSFTVSRARVDWTALSDDPTYLAQLEPLFRIHAHSRRPQVMTTTCRFAAILAADVVGYCRLMGDHSVRLTSICDVA